MDSLQISNHQISKNGAHLLNLKMAASPTVSMSSETVFQASAKMIKQMVFPINTEQDKGLHKSVVEMENKVIDLLTNLDNSLLNKLPLNVQSIIQANQNNPSKWKTNELFREAYRTTVGGEEEEEENNQSCAWFRGDAYTRCFNWDGTPIQNPMEELSIGDYQFILRVPSIYIGSHGSHNAIANVIIRVAALRFRPKENSPPPPPMNWDYSSDNPAVHSTMAADTSNSTIILQEDEKTTTRSAMTIQKKRGRKPLKLLRMEKTDPQNVYIEDVTMHHINGF